MLCENPNEQADGAQYKAEAETQQDPLLLGCLMGFHGYAQEVGVRQGGEDQSVLVQ